MLQLILLYVHVHACNTLVTNKTHTTVERIDISVA